MGNDAKWQYFWVMYERYHRAERKKRPALLDEFCATTDYNRKYAIRLLNGPRPEKERVKRPRGRKPLYGKQVISILAEVWEAAGYLGMTVEILSARYGHHHPDYLSGATRAFRKHREALAEPLAG